MRVKKGLIFNIIGFIIAGFIYCEFLIYYVVIFQCSWPVLENEYHNADEKPVYAMFLADTHLLGKIHGHWFDKLRREWQMHRSFQTSMTLKRPEFVFVLGDLFDEGEWSTGIAFNEYIERFHSMFPVPQSTKMYFAAGNHDIGFHYKITPYLSDRFEMKMNTPSVQLVSVRGNHFVIINSMAMEGDGCFLCKEAEGLLKNISSALKCFKDDTNCIANKGAQSVYSRPILLQHFPLYRSSDEMCTESDSAPPETKSEKFRERWDCLSRESTQFLVETLSPRVALGGHTHHSCYIQYNPLSPSEKMIEYSVPSFSWRNRNDPSVLLGVFTPHEFKISKCRMPKENTVILLYIIFSIFIFIYTIYNIQKRKGRSYSKRSYH